MQCMTQAIYKAQHTAWLTSTRGLQDHQRDKGSGIDDKGHTSTSATWY